MRGSTSDLDAERLIVIGLAVSGEFAARLRPIFRRELLANPEYARIADWCVAHFDQYHRAPGPEHLGNVYFEKLKTEAIPKDEAEFIQDVLRNLSDRYGDGTSFDVDFAFDRGVAYLNRRTIEAAAEEATDAAERGDFSRARLAGWKIATVAAPAARLPDPWADPEPPPFDASILPKVLRRFALAKASAIGVEPSAVAWAAIAACAGALDGSLRLEMKRSDPDFAVPPALWVLLVGPPSSGKSPVLKDAFAPLRRIQAEGIAEWERDLQRWDDGDPKERGPKPSFVQFVTNDATTEGLRDLLAAQDRGVVALADELSRHIGSLGRYSGGNNAGAADQGFYNAAFDGGPAIANRANRKGGERMPIKNLLIALVGGVQPDILRSFNRNNALTGDGMMQRCIPVLMGTPRLGDAVETGTTSHAYGALVERLTRVRGGRTLRLSEAAEAVRERVERDVFRYGGVGSLGSGFATATRKLVGIWGRLALVMAFVAADPDDPGEVDEAAAALAERLVLDSVVPNLVLFYRDVLGGGENIDVTRSIAGLVLRERRVRLTARDVTHRCSALHRAKVDQVRDAVSPLVAMEWLKPEGDERHGSAWEVNQAIYGQFAERAAAEAASAALIRDTLEAKFGKRGEDTAAREGENGGEGYCARNNQRNQPGEDGGEGYCAREQGNNKTSPDSMDSTDTAHASRARNNQRSRMRDAVLAAMRRDRTARDSRRE